jgi:L-2-hydroxyglutarate oxidase LhgO
MEQVDCVVIGAGVVGLAIARQLAMAGREVLICEAEGQIGQHCSSRNSEVIHAGLYYPTGSLKARLCVQGRAMLYRYCAERHIPHQRIGKLLLANTAADCPLAGHCPTRRRQWRG